MTPPVLIFDSKERWFPVGVEESLAPLGYTWASDRATWVTSDGPVTRLNFPSHLLHPLLPLVGYRRVVPAAGLYWEQFWLWYLMNPKQYLGEGSHEGDFEVCQIAHVDKSCEKPVLVTLSQHHTGAKREAWRTVRKGQRVQVYVARDSHAMYFTPTADLEDVADGKGRVAENMTWREFGAWATWPGRWGNSTGVGQSPESPGRQTTRWQRPHVFHGQAR